jgi:hypothetical protein
VTAAVSASIDAVGDHPLVRGLDLTGVELVGLTGGDLPPWAEAVLAVGGRAAAYTGVTGASRVVVFGFDPDGGTLAGRLAFPLLVNRAVATGWARIPAVVEAGAPVLLPEAAESVRMPDGASAPARGAFDATGEPGWYAVRLPAPSGGRQVRFAVHAGDAAESDLRRTPGAPLASDGRMARGAAAGREWWPALAALALVVMFGEATWRARLPLERRSERGGT